MPIAGVVAAVAIVGIAIAVAVARFRSQVRLGKTAKRVEHSQRRLVASLETLSNVIVDVQTQGSLVASGIRKRQLIDVRHYPGLMINAGCPLCGSWWRLQTPAVIDEGEAGVDTHRPVRARDARVHRENAMVLPRHPWDPNDNGWLDEWVQNQPESIVPTSN